MSGRDPELRIELLGGFRVAAGATAAPESAWRLRKARAIVKLLALAPEHSLHRDRVIEVLWPERDPTAASNNLRQAVFVARRALDSCGASGSANLSLHADVLRLGANGVAVDVEAFESAAERAEQAPSLEHHSAAVALYHGELLPEDRFEPWAQSRREALRERYVALLVDVARLHQAAGDLAAATAALQQALREDPLAERAHASS